MIAPVVLALTVGFLGWAYQALKPPPPKICGSPVGPPVTSPRVKLNDGRYLAYREFGVPKEEAKHKIVIIHGFDSSKDLHLPISRELIDELRIYFLFFDRAGYGESDPYPSRSVKSEAYDIQELADLLQIGSKFYVIGISMGAYPVWSCLKYIPHRPASYFKTMPLLSLFFIFLFLIFNFLNNVSAEVVIKFFVKHASYILLIHHCRLLGASLVVPFVNYWWPCIPANLLRESFQKLQVSDQQTFRVAHYFPWLLHWWMMAGNMEIFTPKDLEILKKISESPSVGQEKVRQQGEHESLYRDLLASYGKWEFDPIDLTNPFPNNEGSVHIWQGYEDRIIPYKVNRYIAEKLPWIHYHEVPDYGHFLFFERDLCEAVLKALLLG